MLWFEFTIGALDDASNKGAAEATASKQSKKGNKYNNYYKQYY